MRRVTLAARRAQLYLRRPPRPWWVQPLARAARLGLAMAVLVAGVWALSASGVFTRLAAGLDARVLALTGEVGLVVRQIYVDGRNRTAEHALREAIGAERGDPLLALDPAGIKARVEQLPWVGRASVARRWPDILHVHLFERQPLALWQRDGRYELIDRAGEVIEGVVTGAGGAARFRHLRVLVGEDAPRHAARLFAALSTEPELWARVVAASRVGGRRWTLRLDNDVDVLLPEERMLDAWRLLARTEREQQLLGRAITLVDLRLVPDRMRLRLAPAVLEDRRA